MKIVNHRLIGEGVKFMQSPNTSGLLKSILYLVAHDDEGASMAGTESWILNPASKVSYHVLIGRNGEVTQFVDFNKRAYHAGVSSWKGLSDLNWYTIGVSMQNRNKQPYTEKQIEKYIEVSKVICDHYGIKEAVGHRQIAPTRKTDPHDGFPWVRFNQEVFSIQSTVKQKKTSANLNLRECAGVDKTVLLTIPKGSIVNIINDLGEWSEVSYNSVTGFVSNKYLI